MAANKRMFNNSIIDSDAFLDMPNSSRLLYFDLNMRADDDGFINSPKKIIRMTGASDDDLKLLIIKKFIIPFESGIIVIKHWKIHNYIRKDMYKETNYKDEKALLFLDENNAYTLENKQALQECNETVTELSTQIRLDKIRLDKSRLDKSSSRFAPPTLTEIETYIVEKNLNVNAKAFYDYFTEGKWIDSNGKRVRNWKQKLLTWHNKENKQKRIDNSISDVSENANEMWNLIHGDEKQDEMWNIVYGDKDDN